MLCVKIYRTSIVDFVYSVKEITVVVHYGLCANFQQIGGGVKRDKVSNN